MVLLAAGVLGAVVVAAGALVLRARASATLVHQIAARELPRTIGPRVSTETKFHPCSPVRKGVIPAADCANAPVVDADEGLHALQQRVVREAQAGAPEGIHAEAMLDLLWADTSVASITRVVERLQGLVSFGNASADVLSDLSATLLVRAGRRQSLADLLTAAEAAEQAIALDSTHLGALFNHALALEALTMEDQAGQAWAAYLAVDAAGDWAAEARRHSAALQWSSRPKPHPRANDSALVALAGSRPQEAREFGWETLLPAWGAAVLANDAAAAGASLHRAEILGQELARRGRDASLADAVRAIRSHTADPAVTRRLAVSHRAFGEGRQAFSRMEYARADSLLTLSNDSSAGSPLLQRWSAVSVAPLRSGGDPDAAVRLVQGVIEEVDPVRYPALAGKAYRTLGSISVKENDPSRTLPLESAAVRLLLRSGETETTGEAWGGHADAEHLKGDRQQAYRDAYNALAILRDHRDSQSLRRVLAMLQVWLAEDGYTKTALRVSGEDVVVARRTGVAGLVAEAQDFHAEALAHEGRTDDALAALEAARVWLDRLDAPLREYMDALMDGTRGVIAVRSDPLKAEAQLTKALRFIGKPAAGVPLRLIHVLLARAEARAALGKADSARADTDAVLAMLAEAQGGDSGWRVNRELSRSVRATLNSVVLRLAADQKPRDALELFERGLASLGQPETSAIPESPPPGQAVVRYGVVGNTLLVWTLSSRGLALVQTGVPQRELAERVRSAREALQDRDDDAARAELEALYDLLIRPVAPRLDARDTSLVIIPDGVLAGVPFSALRDRTTGEYLVERHLVRRAASLAQVGRAVPEVLLPNRGAVVVLDPAFDPQLFPRLRRLPGASRELAYVRGWAGAGPNLRVLSDDGAVADSLGRLLPRVSVLHFAGHAISNDGDPDSSFLVLASGHGAAGAGRLT
ncbi:MAG TPA: CHAT domain-containing protein, partial [Longimicrobium sp.]